MKDNIIDEFFEIYQDAVKNNKSAADFDIGYEPKNKSFYYNDIQITRNSIAGRFGDGVAKEILKWVRNS